jgi:hypothetical protein
MEAATKRAAAAVIAKDESTAQLNQAKAQATLVDAQISQEAAPIANALKQLEAMKTAAEAGQQQAGGF